jgi:hypothetical protein
MKRAFPILLFFLPLALLILFGMLGSWAGFSPESILSELNCMDGSIAMGLYLLSVPVLLLKRRWIYMAGSMVMVAILFLSGLIGVPASNWGGRCDAESLVSE